MTTTHILGYPRIGERRELKFALESFWQGQSDGHTLRGVARQLRQASWQRQRDAGKECGATNRLGNAPAGCRHPTSSFHALLKISC